MRLKDVFEIRESFIRITFPFTQPVTTPAGTQSGLSRNQVQILRNCLTEKAIGELLKTAGRTNRTKFRDQVLRPLLDAGWLEMTIPDKPTSSKQKYRLTGNGRALLDKISKGI